VLVITVLVIVDIVLCSGVNFVAPFYNPKYGPFQTHKSKTPGQSAKQNKYNINCYSNEQS
jgi:hypothetical protein